MAYFIFQWLLISLFTYRTQRLVTTDTIYPFRRLREYLNLKSAPTRNKPGFHIWSELDELITCPHCMGVWLSSITYAIAAQHLNIPLTFLQCIATMAFISITADHGHDGE